MSKDPYTALWLSHSSISDFLKCPRSYYLKNVYKDPKTGHKIQLMSPALALGQAVHGVLESLSVLPTKDRFKQSLLEKFEQEWQKVSGKNGGFHNPEQEQAFKKRGEEMIRRVIAHPGPLAGLAVKIKEDLPHFWLSEEDNLILCGKVDWLEYLPDNESVNIIDFKTSLNAEDPDSLQLPIYHLLVKHCQSHEVARASYWYLENSNDLEEKVLPDLVEAEKKLIEIGKRIKVMKKLGVMKCPHGDKGCYACRGLERVIRGEAEFVKTGEYNRDIYILPPALEKEVETQSVIL